MNKSNFLVSFQNFTQRDLLDKHLRDNEILIQNLKSNKTEILKFQPNLVDEILKFKSPKIEKICIDGFKFYILRDDLIGVINGNKARKLELFLNIDLSEIENIVCCGSSQSNAGYNLSLFAKLKRKNFYFVIEHLSENLKQNPSGNFKFMLQNNANIIVSENREKTAKLIAKNLPNSLFIPEGVAMNEAQMGFANQAKFIDDFAKSNGLNFDIFLPSGTGTSATYLAKYSKFSVFTTPCVGDTAYLKKQILALDKTSKVQILPPPRKFHFGKPYAELYGIWQKTKAQTGIEFDLIYDPVGLLTLLANREKFTNGVLYIHQGGILGNISQFARYRYKFFKNQDL